MIPLKFFQRLAAGCCRCHGMSVMAKIGGNYFKNPGFIVDEENVEGRPRFYVSSDGRACSSGIFGERQADCESSSLAGGRLNFQLASMSLYYSVDHGKPKAGAELALCREKRFEATLADTFTHARPGIADVNNR